MHSISSSFGSRLAGGVIPRLPKGGAAQSGGPAAPSAGLRFKAWLAESGWYRGVGCRQALQQRNNYLLSSAAAYRTGTLPGETNFKSLFERQVKSVGGFDKDARPAEARAARAMTRLIGLARLAGTDSYEAQARLVIREAQAEQAAANLFRTSQFHGMLKDNGVNADLVNRFEDDFCRRCASCARASPSEVVEAIVKSQLGLFLPSDGRMEKLLRLNLSEGSSAARVLSNYLAEMRNRMWTINERNSAELPGFSPDHQLHRHILRRVLELAVRDVSRQPEVKAWARHVRDAKEHCMSKIDLLPDERLTRLALGDFISRYFYDQLPFNWDDDSSSSELVEDEDEASDDNTSVSSRSEVIGEAGAPEPMTLDSDSDTEDQVGLWRNGERVRRFSFPDSGDDNN